MRAQRSCPRALVAKRGDVRIREKEGFKCPWFCEHRATREPKAVVCTLGTLNTDCGKAFSLLRFFVAVGQRNEVPPRTVANSDKKYCSHPTRANVSSNNPAPTPTTAGSAPQNPDQVRTPPPGQTKNYRPFRQHPNRTSAPSGSATLKPTSSTFQPATSLHS